MNLPAAFDGRVLDLALERLLPTRSLPKEIIRLRKYTQIMASMQEVGLIEPLSIMPGDPKTGMHMILDGHVRLRIARDLGWERIACIVARDDEGFTYNRRVNRLATIQEHFMILRALERGVQEAHLARALDVNIGTIRHKRNLLDGICPEVVELLKEQHFLSLHFLVIGAHQRRGGKPRAWACSFPRVVFPQKLALFDNASCRQQLLAA